MPVLLTVDVRTERDIVAARQRTRALAEQLGFDPQDRARLATAVSEVTRNALQYGGGGLLEYATDGQNLAVTVADRGPGIPDVPAALDGRTHTGFGLAGAICVSRHL